jgi:hypothetical protein
MVPLVSRTETVTVSSGSSLHPRKQTRLTRPNESISAPHEYDSKHRSRQCDCLQMIGFRRQSSLKLSDGCRERAAPPLMTGDGGQQKVCLLARNRSSFDFQSRAHPRIVFRSVVAELSREASPSRRPLMRSITVPRCCIKSGMTCVPARPPIHCIPPALAR